MLYFKYSVRAGGRAAGNSASLQLASAVLFINMNERELGGGRPAAGWSGTGGGARSRTRPQVVVCLRLHRFRPAYIQLGLDLDACNRPTLPPPYILYTYIHILGRSVGKKTIRTSRWIGIGGAHQDVHLAPRKSGGLGMVYSVYSVEYRCWPGRDGRFFGYSFGKSAVFFYKSAKSEKKMLTKTRKSNIKKFHLNKFLNLDFLVTTNPIPIPYWWMNDMNMASGPARPGQSLDLGWAGGQRVVW